MSIKNLLDRFKTLLVGNDGIFIIDSEDNNLTKQITFDNLLLNIAQNYIVNYVSKTANYTTLITDDVVYCDGTFTVNLITVIDRKRPLIIANISTGIITIDPFGSETISGETTFDVYEGESVVLHPDTTNWILIC